MAVEIKIDEVEIKKWYVLIRDKIDNDEYSSALQKKFIKFSIVYDNNIEYVPRL